MNKRCVLTKELYDCQIDYLAPYFEESTYPWEILPKIKEIVSNALKSGLKGYTLLKEGVLVGENVTIAQRRIILR